MADEDLERRRFEARRACARRLSGNRPQTMAEQLEQIASSGIDLDAPVDFYGGGIVGDLETRVAGLLGTEAAAFFPTGTMAQQIALRIWAERAGNPTVALHPLHHTEVWERKAYSTLTGLRSVWPTAQRRSATPEEIRDLPEQFSVLAIELPLREPGFLLPEWDELVAMCEAARERGARVHIDGARLWESVPHLGHDLPTIAALADSVYVSFYKSLGGLGGAALAGDAAFVAAAKAWRHRHGGQIFQQWPTIVSALAGLDRELPRLPEYVAHAKVVAEAMASLPGAVVYPNPPHTHQFQLWLPYPAKVIAAAHTDLIETERISFADGWSDQALGTMASTEITIAGPALSWTAEDVVEAGTKLLARAAAA